MDPNEKFLIVPREEFYEYASKLTDSIGENNKIMREVKEALLHPPEVKVASALDKRYWGLEPEKTASDIKDYALDTAKTDFQISIVGDQISPVTDGTLDGVYVRLNKPTNPRIPLKYFNPYNTPTGFDRLFLTHSAQAGKTLWLHISTGARAYAEIYDIIKKTYREERAEQDENWDECMFITKTEFATDFNVTHQTLNKIYAPVTKSGAKTIALVSSKGFTGKTNTLLEITIDTLGDPPTAKFKWRKKTFLGDIWGAYTEGVTTGADITVTDGIHINFNDTGYAVGNQWHVQACGSWHTPGDGKHSYMTSVFVYPFDSTPAAKAGYFRIWRGDYRVVDYITTKGEFPNWRTPMHLLGDGTKQFKVEIAELVKGQIDSVFCVMKGWDE